MSEQDVNTMRTAYEAFSLNRADIPAVLEAFELTDRSGNSRAADSVPQSAPAVPRASPITSRDGARKTSMSSRPNQIPSSTPASTSSWSAPSAASPRPAASCRPPRACLADARRQGGNHVEAAPWAVGWSAKPSARAHIDRARRHACRGMRVGERGRCGSGAQLALQPSAQGAASTWF